MRSFWENIKEKLDELLDRIPLKLQVLINVLGICILAVMIYVFTGGPTVSVEHQFRRAERENMVGPGEILGIEELAATLWADHLVVAKTQEGVILFAQKRAEQENISNFVYRPMTGDIMICGSPALLSSLHPPHGDPLTVIIFDAYPEAVRAELDMELFWENAETQRQYRYQYSLSGERSNQGYFRLDLPYEWSGYSGPGVHAEDTTIQQFVAHSQDASYRAPKGEYPATVRLYNDKDELILQREMFIFQTEE